MALIASTGHGLNVAWNSEELAPDERNSVKDILLQRTIHSRHSWAYSSGLLRNISTGLNLSTEINFKIFWFQK